MTLELEIEGVPDRAIAGAIRKRVRTLGQQIVHSGDWYVRLAPSEARVEWDLGIRTASGWQIVSFTAPMERLADLVEQALRVRLVVPVADASGARQ